MEQTLEPRRGTGPVNTPLETQSFHTRYFLYNTARRIAHRLGLHPRDAIRRLRLRLAKGGRHQRQPASFCDALLSRIETLGAKYTGLRFNFASYLSGTGIEIGALHNPVPVAPGVIVRYVDKLAWEQLPELYPEVQLKDLVRPDIVCDTYSLAPIPDASLDFVIASHVLEHLDNPLKAMLAWHRVLRPGGLVLCIVPDARFTFDNGRPLATLGHLLWDLVNDGTETKALSDLFHIAECNLTMHSELSLDAAVDLAKTVLRQSYDTHFHVWTYETFFEQMQTLIRNFAFPFKIRESACDGELEMLFLFESVPTKEPFGLPEGKVPRSKR